MNNKYMDGWTDRRTLINGWINTWINRWIHVYLYCIMVDWADGQMDGWMDWKTDGLIYRQIYGEVIIHVQYLNLHTMIGATF